MFSRSTGASDHEFNSIFHLLDELDRHLFHRRRLLHTYVPRFDLEEFSNSYVLTGEVPGLQRSDLSLIATDNHSLEIHGQTPRAEVRESSKEPEEDVTVSKNVDTLNEAKDSLIIERSRQHGRIATWAGVTRSFRTRKLLTLPKSKKRTSDLQVRKLLSVLFQNGPPVNFIARLASQSQSKLQKSRRPYTMAW